MASLGRLRRVPFITRGCSSREPLLDGPAVPSHSAIETDRPRQASTRVHAPDRGGADAEELSKLFHVESASAGKAVFRAGCRCALCWHGGLVCMIAYVRTTWTKSVSASHAQALVQHNRVSGKNEGGIVTQSQFTQSKENSVPVDSKSLSELGQEYPVPEFRAVLGPRQE